MDKSACDAALQSSTSADGPPLSLHGRRAIVSVAVDRSSAQTFSSESKQRRTDRRHLHLAQEGAVADTLVPACDRAKRDRAAADMRSKLRSPLFAMSPVRLSVRNLARGIGDSALRKLCRSVRSSVLVHTVGGLSVVLSV